MFIKREAGDPQGDNAIAKSCSLLIGIVESIDMLRYRLVLTKLGYLLRVRTCPTTEALVAMRSS
jgi:hypothetical protein